jgi:AcrR family transcriptional regulator
VPGRPGEWVGVLDRPAPRWPRSARAAAVVATARRLLEEDPAQGLTLRRVAEAVGVRTPSLYKHLPSKAALEAALVEVGLAEMGAVLRQAVGGGPRRGAAERLLRAYREAALSNPGLYRLVTGGPLPRVLLPPGLEAWAGEPFRWAAGDPAKGQALWALAHGLVVLELDRRFLPGSDLGRTWAEGAAAFEVLRDAGDSRA